MTSNVVVESAVSEHTERPLAAASLIFSAMLVLGILDSAVALAAEGIGLWQFHLFRSILAVSILFGLARMGVISLAAKRRWAVAMRGGLTGFSMLFYFGSLAFLPLGQVAAGLFTAPIWVMLISAVFLGKPIGFRRMLAAAIGFFGVMLVLQPFADGVQLLSLFPVVAGLFYALGAITTRTYCEGESTFAMLLYFFGSLGVFGAIGCVALALFPQVVPAGADGFILRGMLWPDNFTLAIIATQAIGSMAAIGLIFRGYQLGDAGQVAIFEYSMLPFAAGWSFLLFGDTLNLMAAGGMVMIIVSGIIISMRSPSR